MPAPSRVLLHASQAGLKPARCQHGHDLVWLLEGTEPNGDGVILAGCPCALRDENGRTGRGMSTPCLWRYVPPGGGAVTRLTPYFPSMNRAGFALAVKLYRLAAGTDQLLSHLTDAKIRAKQTAVLAAKAQLAAGRLAQTLEARNQAVHGPDGA